MVFFGPSKLAKGEIGSLGDNMSLSYCCHDHIVLLLDKETFENLPSFLSSNFKVIEGGTHAGTAPASRDF